MRAWTVYARAIATIDRNRRTAILLLLANIAVAVLQFADPLIFGRVIELLAGPRAGGGAARLLALWAGIAACGIGLGIATALRAERLAHRSRLEAMRGFFEHALSLPQAFHGHTQSGRLMKTMFGGADAMFWLWLFLFRDQLASFTALLVLLPLTLLLNWRLALVLVGLVVVFAVLTLIVVRRAQGGQARAQGWQTRLAGSAQDALANVVVVQSFGRVAAEARLFAGMVEQVIAHQFPVLTWWALLNVATRAASTIAVITLVVAGMALHGSGQAQIGDIVSFMGFATLLIGRLEGAMNFITRLSLDVPAIGDFFAVLDAADTVPEMPHAPPLRVTAGAVAFEDVRFSYPAGAYPDGAYPTDGTLVPANPPVLRGISFAAARGQVVALVGPTGAGKTTAMALLQRMWDPDRGAIRIDGQDLRAVSRDSLRAAIGVVFQESLLLNRSIRDNVLIGRPQADDAALRAACRLADAEEFILRQGAGYDTLVGERGATLSGGQRQRLAIARALLKDPPILILDEATSALDAATEARIAASLKTLMAGRTTFIIAHRLSTVREADHILVFEDGRVVEQGRFAALLAQGGRFAALVDSQLASAER
ncbi:MAG: ATP-binding cassette domain-containing protein [Rhodospirillales bacterium]|nr:ATP-binding cassette domain-containing protein [Rhodospirillales bacterium]